MQIKKAVRRAVPMQLAFYGPTSSGKTMSALRFAAGLAGDGKVCIVDTEKGRASLYADNAKVRADLPAGFDVIELDAPYHPKRFIEAIDLCEQSGYRVCIIDSGSDSWDGPGGCCDIAESKKKMWTEPKMWNKRMMTRAALSEMHIIWCLKAQEKTKVVGKEESDSGKQEYIDLGVLPIWEKSNLFSQLLAFSVDPKTHLSTAVKCHDDLQQFFKEPVLMTRAHGEMVRKWNESGQAAGENDQLIRRAEDAASQGIEMYEQLFKGITPAQRRALAHVHEANKKTAQAVTAEMDRGLKETLAREAAGMSL